MTQFPSLLAILFLALLSVVNAAPADPSTGPVETTLPSEVEGTEGHAGRPGRCRETRIRREWRALSIKQRLSYINAVKCLNTLPSANPSHGTVSRYDDFIWTHVQMTPGAHLVGQFYPWHRHFVTLYDSALRDECGYRGPTPYWDWSIEGDKISSFASSPLFHPVHGFGGTGVPGTYTLPPDPNNLLEFIQFPCIPAKEIVWNGCVQSGPFKDTEFRINVGPGRMMTDHCVVRNFDTTCWGPLLTSSAIANTLLPTDYWSFHDATNNGAHLGGHAIFGGVMLNAFSSPGDPLFYLHHGGMDRLWTTWQAAAPGRLSEIGGPTTFPPGSEQTTLDFVLQYPGLAPNITVREVMDISKKPSCYAYDELIN